VADHPVNVPAELFTEWLSEASLNHDHKSGTVAALVANHAAQWGADQELEACCKWLEARGFSRVDVDYLRAARCPKPPTLAEQALQQYKSVEGILHHLGCIPAGCIRAALNRLAELEAQQ
jgi:hypothetical protein